MTLEIGWVETQDGFQALADEWDAIVPDDSRPFILHCWHAAWFEAFAGRHRLAVCTVREDGRLKGALPLLRDGRHLEAGNVHSCIYRPVSRDMEAVEAMATAALDGAASVRLNELLDGDLGVERFAATVRDAGMSVLIERATVSPVVDTGDDVDTWIEQANTSWIKRVHRYRRKVIKDYETEFELFTVPDDLQTELAHCFELEARGWKGRAGTAIVSQPETAAFYSKVAEVFQARGELRINRIRLDGELAAFNICIEYGGRLYALKTAYNEDFRKVAPGLVLQVSLVEACFERGLEAYEILGEEAEWKRNLATSRHTHSTLRAYRRTPVGLARYGYRARLRPRLKRARNRFEGLRR